MITIDRRPAFAVQVTPDPGQKIANQIAYLDHLYRRSQMGFRLEGELADRLESEIRKGLGI